MTSHASGRVPFSLPKPVKGNRPRQWMLPDFRFDDVIKIWERVMGQPMPADARAEWLADPDMVKLAQMRYARCHQAALRLKRSGEPFNAAKWVATASQCGRDRRHTPTDTLRAPERDSRPSAAPRTPEPRQPVDRQISRRINEIRGMPPTAEGWGDL